MLAVVGSLVLVVLVAGLDVLTGPAGYPSLLYVLPIAVLAWVVGWWAGLLLAVLSAAPTLLPWWVPGPPPPAAPELLVPAWTVVQVGVLALVAWLTARVHTLLQREQARARQDQLTGLINAHGFAEVVGGEVARLQRYHHPFSLAYLDLDDFKTINDRLGHRAGDAVLRTVAMTLRRSLRPSDVVARLGGDEFAILLPETDAAAAQAVLERVHTTLVLVCQEHDWPVTASIGLLTCRRPAAVEEVLELADRLMYAGKRQGKNQVQQDVINGASRSRP